MLLASFTLTICSKIFVGLLWDMENGKYFCYADSDSDEDDNYPHGNMVAGVPPTLSRDNYFYWKSLMMLFLKYMDIDLPDTIKEGRFVPQICVVKEKSQWSEEDSRKVALDAKAKRFLLMSLPNDIFRSVMDCDTAKEMWDTLGVLLEETAEEKKYKRSLLVQQYELFSAKVGESLFDTYLRFGYLLNDLKRYDTTFDNEEMLVRFLESLPSVWSTVTFIIRHVKDLSKMSLQDLYGNLLIQESKIKQKQARGKETHNTCKLKKASTRPQEVSEEDTDDEKDFQDLNETMALVIMKCQGFTMRTGYKPDHLTLEMLSKCVATVKNLDTLIQSVGSNLKEKRRYYKYKAKYQSQKLKAKKGRNFVVEDAGWSSTSSSD